MVEDWVVDRRNPYGQVRHVWDRFAGTRFREIREDASLKEDAIEWHREFVTVMPGLQFQSDEKRGDMWGMLGILIYYFKNPNDTFFSEECEEAAYCFEQCLKYTPKREDIKANLRMVKPIS
jgi:hypothetical protein